MRNRATIAFVCIAGLLRGVALGSAAAQTPSDAAVAAAVVQEPRLPDVGLAPISGFTDDAAYVRSVSDRVASLEVSAAREDPGLRRAATFLAGANLVLSRQIEPACSRRLLRIDGDHVGGLRKALDHADDLLTRAESLLKESAGVSESPSERDELAQHHKTLRAFSAGLRAYLLSENEDPSQGTLRRAVSLLSPLIEDQRKSVSAAATLWQACLRSRESDVSGALSVLDLAVTRPAEGAMPYALFARVERCRLLAKQGGRATALALLMQVEGRCEEWIGETEKQFQAVRVMQMAQMQILDDWFDGGGSDGSDGAEKGNPDHRKQSEKEWCANRINKLKEEGFGEDDTGLFRLSEAIPIIAEPPTTEKEKG